jgi:hypothetical protein
MLGRYEGGYASSFGITDTVRNSCRNRFWKCALTKILEGVRVVPTLSMDSPIRGVAVNQSNVKHYRHAKTITDYKKFPRRSHYSVIGGEGWEKVADYAFEWAVEHAKRQTA